MKKLLFLFTIIFCAAKVNSQQHQVDSLNLLLKSATSDTARLRIYIALGDACDVKDNLKYGEPSIVLADKLLATTKDSILMRSIWRKKLSAYQVLYTYYQSVEGVTSPKLTTFLQKKLELFKLLRDKEGVRDVLLDIADAYGANGDVMQKLEALKQGLVLMQKMGFKGGQSRFIVQIGFLYGDQGDTASAIDYLEKGLKLEKEIGDTTRAARGLLIAGIFYAKVKQYDKALDLYRQATPLFERKNDIRSLSDVYLKMGEAYTGKKDLSRALECYEKSYSVVEGKDQMQAIIGSLIGLGDTYLRLGNINKAIEFHQKALTKCEVIYVDYGIALSCFALAKDYFIQKNFIKAKTNGERSLDLMKKIGGLVNVSEGEFLVSKIDSASGNYKEAYYHYQEYVKLKNQLNSDEVHKAAAIEKFQNEVAKQKELDKAEQDKKDALSAAESRKQKIIIGAVALGLLLVLGFAGFVFRSLRLTKKQKEVIEIKSKETEQQKHLIEEKNNEIIDSITYAKRLQQAILPSLQTIKENLPESFVYYQPKDIVAGDFYWMEHIDGYTYIAAADCTGHGVPGAMVSVVCSNALNRTVKEFGLRYTGDILDKTRELVIETFEKSGESVKDGMDISLLRIKKNEVQWSGANNSLWYVLNSELIEVKADKQPIGKYNEIKPFTTHNLVIDTTASFYLFSDGYADQFSPADKKLMKKKFKDSVFSIQHLPMQEQGMFLEKLHVDWKGDMEQTDDVLVIGVRI